MFRFIDAPRRIRRAWRRPAGVHAALVLPVLTPILLAVAEVTSVGVSSEEVAAGGTVTGRVTVTPSRFTRGTSVRLTSSDPSIMTVPTSVFVSTNSPSNSANFTVSTAPGAIGCPHITARVLTTPARTATVFIRPPATDVGGLSLQIPDATVAPLTVTGTVSILRSAPPPGPLVVQLSSSSQFAIVPPSVTVSSFSPFEGGGSHVIGTASFQIQTVDPGSRNCSIITATLDGVHNRRLLKIVTVGG